MINRIIRNAPPGTEATSNQFNGNLSSRCWGTGPNQQSVGPTMLRKALNKVVCMALCKATPLSRAMHFPVHWMCFSGSEIELKSNLSTAHAVKNYTESLLLFECVIWKQHCSSPLLSCLARRFTHRAEGHRQGSLWCIQVHHKDLHRLHPSLFALVLWPQRFLIIRF